MLVLCLLSVIQMSMLIWLFAMIPMGLLLMALMLWWLMALVSVLLSLVFVGSMRSSEMSISTGA